MIYCKDCKYFILRNKFWREEICNRALPSKDNITGITYHTQIGRFSVLNKNNNCEYYKKSLVTKILNTIFSITKESCAK